MSYLVLARKWRPQTFDDVVNQKHVVLTLKNALREKRLANAYLFTGPRGIGKTTVARILAKAVNCDQGISENPCNQCDSCVEITEGRSLTVFEIDGASNTGVDDVRRLQEQLSYTTTKDKYKIYIIDEVHMLSKSAFNALLKTLEEPPKNVMFIFATTEPHKLPATIISRCQRFDFKRISMKEIVERLKYICQQEKIEIEDEALFLIAKKAEGGMRDSQSLLDQAISFCGNKITMSAIVDLLGVIDWELFFQFTDAILKQDISAGLNLVEKVFFNGYGLGEFLNGLAEHFRNILLVKATNSVESIETAETFKQRYLQIIDQFEDTELLQLMQIVADAQNGIKWAVNPRIFMEMIAMKMIQLNKTERIDALLQGIDALKERFLQAPGAISAENAHNSPIRPTGAAPVRNAPITQKKIPIIKNETGSQRVPASPGDSNQEASDDSESLDPPSAHSSAEHIDIEFIKKNWEGFLDKVQNEKIAFGSFLAEGDPVRWENGSLTIAFGMENDFHAAYLEKHLKEVEAIVSRILGIAAHLTFVKVERQIPETGNGDNGNYYLQKLGQKIPLIKDIDEAFDVEVVK
ncbi:MAG: DNA polymerase III subunit gamma/tau [Calditrichaeota bacterium]|nr:DNA polymerase III subunit gamma/tau [Calditrichota bacterium]